MEFKSRNLKHYFDLLKTSGKERPVEDLLQNIMKMTPEGFEYFKKLADSIPDVGGVVDMGVLVLEENALFLISNSKDELAKRYFSEAISRAEEFASHASSGAEGSARMGTVYRLKAHLSLLNSGLDESFDYWKRKGAEGVYEIYRSPRNLIENVERFAAMERLLENLNWDKSSTQALRNEWLQGWFDFESDRLTPAEAKELILDWVRRSMWPGLAERPDKVTRKFISLGRFEAVVSEFAEAAFLGDIDRVNSYLKSDPASLDDPDILSVLIETKNETLYSHLLKNGVRPREDDYLKAKLYAPDFLKHLPQNELWMNRAKKLSSNLRLSQGLLRGELQLKDVIQLFADGADSNAEEASFGGAEPTMILAARYPDIQIIQFLLKSGSYPNLLNKEGKNSLRLILENEETTHKIRKEAVALFQRYEIDPLPKLTAWERFRLCFGMSLL